MRITKMSEALDQLTTATYNYIKKQYQPEPIYDEFQLMVWETRRDSGIIEPKPEPIGYKFNKNILVDNMFMTSPLVAYLKNNK